MLAAQRGVQVAGHNIANANTEGYRRQVLKLAAKPAVSSIAGPAGAGVDMQRIQGMRDYLLLVHLLTQQGSLGRSEALSNRLTQLESSIGSDPETGLNEAINRFFTALTDVERSPEEDVSRDLLVTNATTLADNIRDVYSQLGALREGFADEFAQKINDVNSTVQQIVDLNAEIVSVQHQGFEANDAIDRRDQLLSDLSRLIGVQVVRQDYGSVNVLFEGGMLASDRYCFPLEATTDDSGNLCVEFANDPTTFQVTQGELGALAYLHGALVPDYMARLDELAASLIQQLNAVHATGVGLDGGMQALTSANQAVDVSEALRDCGLPFEVTDGRLRVSVTDQATGEIVQTSINIDADADTLSTLAAKLSAVEHLNATVNEGRLTIQAENGYLFDFSRRLDSNPGELGTAAVQVGGTYSGTTSGAFHLVANRSGTIGSTSDLGVTVLDDSGNALGVLRVGSGFNPGQWLNGPQGVRFSVGSGSLNGAELTSTNTGTFDLSAQGTLLIAINGAPAQTVSLNNADLFDVSAATAQSVVDAIKAQATGLTASVVDGKVSIVSDGGAAGSIQLADGGTGLVAALGLDEALHAQGLAGTLAQPFDLSAGGSITVSVDGGPAQTINLNFADLYDMSAAPVADLAATIRAQTTNMNVSVVDGALRLASALPALDTSIQITDGGTGLTGAIGLSTSLVQADTLSFDVTAPGGSDTSGVLVALGLNGFFTGSGAADIGVDDRVASDTRQFAAAAADPPGDNLNVSQMIQLQRASAVGGRMTFNEAYASLVARVGSDSALHAQSYEAQTVLMEDLKERIDSVSGVSIDEEVANLMMFQQAFQASARVISTLNTMLEVLMQM